MQDLTGILPDLAHIAICRFVEGYPDWETATPSVLWGAVKLEVTGQFPALVPPHAESVAQMVFHNLS